MYLVSHGRSRRFESCIAQHQAPNPIRPSQQIAGLLAMALAREDHLPPVGFLIRIAHVALFRGNKLARAVCARNSLVALRAD